MMIIFEYLSNFFFSSFKKKKKERMPHYNCTFHGLHDWSSRMFEKFGWMVLAHRNGNKDSLKCYIRGLKHLQDEINKKHKETIDKDRRRDLEELLSNVSFLSETAKSVFN